MMIFRPTPFTKIRTLKLLTWIFCLFSVSGIAQFDQSARLELDEESISPGSYSVVPLANKTVLVTSTYFDYGDRVYTRKYELYDSNLKKINEEEVKVSRKLEDRYSYADSSFYCDFFYSRRRGHYQMVKLNLSTFKPEKFAGHIINKVQVNGVYLTDSKVLIDVLPKRQPEFLLSLDPVTDRSNPTFPVVGRNRSGKQISAQEVYWKKEKQVWFTYVDDRGQDDGYVIQRVGPTGDYLPKVSFKVRKDKFINDISYSRVSENRTVVSGSYSLKKTTASVGVFFGILESGKIHSLKFTEFKDMSNFLDYMSDKNRYRLARKRERKENRGKDFQIYARIALHDVRKNGDEYVVIGESYYPTYRTETYTTTINGVVTTRTEQVFDGFQYTHAFVAGFSEYGVLKWNQCFEMWVNQKPHVVKKFVSVSWKGEELNMLFRTGNEINTMTLKGRDIVNERKIEKVDVKEDAVKTWTWGGDSEHWYGNTFITWGVQKIKSSDKPILQKKREIFFVNKIEF
jgi:hypothetical protein